MIFLIAREVFTKSSTPPHPHVLKKLLYEDRLRQLREEIGQIIIIEIFKMMNGLSAISLSRFFHKAEDTFSRS